MQLILIEVGIGEVIKKMHMPALTKEKGLASFVCL
jgi:hypothetical protein